ncbi:hypothetical protein [Primorskyibacter sp. S87]|uniref:hypothetical protein n=1 Tax=Primorskyibacter sp. S87 TaxID=3415126 RepID=UPI003C7D0FDC
MLNRNSTVTTAFRTVAGAIIAGAMLAPVALAETIDWKTVGGWDISFYPGSEGCQAFALFEEDTAFFLGFDNTDNELVLDVTLLDQRWASIEGGKEYDIEVKFGDETPWSLEMDGIVIDDHPGLNIMIDAGSDEASLFVDEFQRETSMRWSFNDNVLGKYTLRGSRRAFDEVINCQKSYMAALASQSDPFASSSSSDPFAD